MLRKLLSFYVFLLILSCTYLPYLLPSGRSSYRFLWENFRLPLDYSLVFLQIITVTCVYSLVSYLILTCNKKEKVEVER